MCGCEGGSEEEEDLAVSIGEIRPAVLRWLWSTPRQHVPQAIAAVLSIPGCTHPEPARLQSTARQLQTEVEPCQNPVLDQLINSWSDTADIGIVEEILKMAAEGRGREAARQALGMLRNSRKTAGRGENNKQHMTLQGAWSTMIPGRANGSNWTQQTENASTLTSRTQLLGLQDEWPDLIPANRRAILDAILNAPPAGRVQQQAARIAQLYGQIGQDDTPQTLVSLRVALRQPLTSSDQNKNENQDEEKASSSSSGETEKETKGARQRPTTEQKQPKKRRAPSTKKPKLTTKSIRELSQIPHRSSGGSTAAQAVREQGAQTLSRRRQGVTNARPKTEAQMYQELHGDEPNSHDSRDGSTTPPTTRKMTQTGKRRRTQRCEQEPDPERRIESWRLWLPQAARDRLSQQEATRQPPGEVDHEAATQAHPPMTREARHGRQRKRCQPNTTSTPRMKDKQNGGNRIGSRRSTTSSGGRKRRKKSTMQSYRMTCPSRKPRRSTPPEHNLLSFEIRPSSMRRTMRARVWDGLTEVEPRAPLKDLVGP